MGSQGGLPAERAYAGGPDRVTPGDAPPPWSGPWREQALSEGRDALDALVIGGGITGAGLLLEAARRGYRALLVEAGDFASGTSGRSGKLVHGGMRYLKEGRLGLTRSLLLERDRLLRDRPGLVNRLEFILPTYRFSRKNRAMYGVAVRLYDVLRGRRRSWCRYSPAQVEARIPGVRLDGMDGAFGFHDAVTDDARLVLRTLRDAAALGASAVNRARVVGLLREGGRVVGAEVHDTVADTTHAVRARVVFNAAGASADALRGWVGQAPRLRPIRGTHLVLSRQALPLEYAASVRHPADGRYIYMLPWEGATLVGTTDRDHGENGAALRSTGEEVEYLLEALHHWLPGLAMDASSLVGSFAGIRVVVDTGRADPYREKRASVRWEEEGLVTVVSGKLTGFLPVVARALDGAGLRATGAVGSAAPGAEDISRMEGVEASVARRLTGRYGADAPALVAAAQADELSPVGASEVLWAELRWGLRAEGVHHLDDLLLRRARVGLVLPEGGAAHFPRIRTLCSQELGWDATRWEEEEARYRAIWRAEHGTSLPA